METWYDEEEDILNVELEDGESYWKSIELADGIVVDIDTKGRVVALEVQGASKVFSGDRRKVLEAAMRA